MHVQIELDTDNLGIFTSKLKWNEPTNHACLCLHLPQSTIGIIAARLYRVLASHAFVNFAYVVPIEFLYLFVYIIVEYFTPNVLYYKQMYFLKDSHVVRTIHAATPGQLHTIVYN